MGPPRPKKKQKSKRYPGPDLVPFVVRAGGHLGEAAELLIRSKEPLERLAAISAAKRALSNLVQLGKAAVVLGAEQGVEGHWASMYGSLEQQRSSKGSGE